MKLSEKRAFSDCALMGAIQLNVDYKLLGIPAEYNTHYHGNAVVGIGRNGNEVRHGIAALILKILSSHGARFELGAETTEKRPAMVRRCMTQEAVCEAAQSLFTCGGKRYPLSSFRNYLTTNMQSGIHSLPSVGDTVSSFLLTEAEDINKGSGKAHTVFYMVK